MTNPINNQPDPFNQSSQSLIKKAVSYIRVSTNRQARRGGGDEEGYSIPAQRDMNKRKAYSLGAVVAKEFIDRGESAKTNARGDLQEMLNYIKDNRVDYVIVNKIDRLARNRLDDALMTKAVQEAGAALVSATEGIDETPQGMLLHGILAAIAEFYSQNLSTEVLKGMTQKAKTGGTPCMAPLGYVNIRDKDEQGRRLSYVTVDEQRAPLVTLAFECYATGDWSLNDLAAYLESRGLTSKGTAARPARPINANNLHTILTNPYYKGTVIFRGVEYRGKHQPLVDNATWQKVQDVMASHRNGERTRIHNHFLKSTLYCGVCGRRMIVHNAKSRSGAYYPYFVCASKHYKDKANRCEQRAVMISKVEKAVAKLYEYINLSPEYRQLLEAWLNTEIERMSASSNAEIADLTKQQKKLKSEEAKLLQAHYAEAVSLDLLKTEQARINKGLNDIDIRLKRLSADAESSREKLECVLDLVEDCGSAYNNTSDYGKRLMNQAIFQRIEVNADGTIEPTYSEIVGLLVDPRLQGALKAAETASLDNNAPEMTTPPTPTETATTTLDKPQKRKKPATNNSSGRFHQAIDHLQNFFGDGLRSNVLVRVKGLEPP